MNKRKKRKKKTRKKKRKLRLNVMRKIEKNKLESTTSSC